MNLGYRKISFFFGLNLWGFGLLFSRAALEDRNPAGWLVPLFLLVAGSLLLTAALISEDKSN